MRVSHFRLFVQRALSSSSPAPAPAWPWPRPSSRRSPSNASFSSPISYLAFNSSNFFCSDRHLPLRCFSSSPSSASGVNGLNGHHETTRPPKSDFHLQDYEQLHGESFLVLVTHPLVAHVGTRLWEDACPEFSTLQRYVYAFWHADEMINAHGFLAFFYTGRGEVVDDLLAGLAHVQDLETRNLIRRAIKEIEEPRTWALFDKLREQFNQNGDASAIEGSDKLQSIFNPLNELYREKREVALERMEQLVRKNKDEFVIIVPE